MWLNVVTDPVASIYFNEKDEVMVITRDGATLPMPSSPFSQHLERCVVYFDHAHTRRTDLKCPNGSRAAVTLDSKLTKDNLVQSTFGAVANNRSLSSQFQVACGCASWVMCVDLTVIRESALWLTKI
ncbi:hypothetical protein JVU11DRAFT_7060 [Chiua virens]|nr:hypothetical protein JVU11DRAFT_7060 [Chiua virens]